MKLKVALALSSFIVCNLFFSLAFAQFSRSKGPSSGGGDFDISRYGSMTTGQIEDPREGPSSSGGTFLADPYCGLVRQLSAPTAAQLNYCERLQEYYDMNGFENDSTN